VSQSLFPNLSAPNIPELYFRSFCATAASVARHLPRLRAVCDSHEDASLPPPLPWREILDNLNTSLLGPNEGWATGASTVEETLIWTRERVESTAKFLSNTQGQEEIAQVLVAIAAEISDGGAEQILLHLEEINQSSHRLVTECVGTFGSKTAQSRWERCKAAKLSFAQRLDKNSFVPRTLAEQNEIELQVGDRHFTLHSYLTLEFQLYHEYLSHSFAVWDSEDDMFSEGDFALETWTYPKVLGFGFPALLLKKRERESLVDAKGKLDPWGQRQEELELEIRGHWIPEDKLTRILLDLAAVPTAEMPGPARERFLNMLHYLPKVGHKWPPKRQLEIKKTLASEMPIWELGEHLRDLCNPRKTLGPR
jgi:hypothetical protein